MRYHCEAAAAAAAEAASAAAASACFADSVAFRAASVWIANGIAYVVVRTGNLANIKIEITTSIQLMVKSDILRNLRPDSVGIDLQKSEILGV